MGHSRSTLLLAFAVLSCEPARVTPELVGVTRQAIMAPGFQAIASMSQARIGAGGVLLCNGNVLVVGGSDGTSALATSEIYSPLTNTWKAGPTLSLARSGAVVRLADSCDLSVMGGTSNAAPTASVEKLRDFDSTFIDGGLLAQPRSDFFVSERADGTFSLTGGAALPTEVFDPAAGTGVTGGALLAPVTGGAVAALANGDQLFAGSNWQLLPADGGDATFVYSDTGFGDLFTTSVMPNGDVRVVGGRQAGAAVATVRDYSSGTVTTNATLGAARYSHRASVLPDGSLFVHGGIGSLGSALGSGELLAPGSNMFIGAGSSTPRSEHVQVVLPEGPVLIAGGASSGAVSSAEVFDPTAVNVTPVVSQLSPRYQACGAQLNDGRYLRLGGTTATSGPPAPGAEIYDPTTQSWTAAGGPTQPRVGCAATTLNDGRVLVVGDASAALASTTAELFDVSTGQWSATGPLTVARATPAVELLPSGEVMVAGGRGSNGDAVAATELWEPATGTFVGAGAMASPRMTFALNLLSDGSLLATGGVSTAGGAPLRTVERWDPALRSWQAIPSLNVARLGHTATLLSDGSVVVLGGAVPVESQSTIEVLDPSFNGWTQRSASAYQRSGHAALRLPFNRLLAAGNMAIERIDPFNGGANLTVAVPTITEPHAVWMPDGTVLIVGNTNALLYDERRTSSAPPSLNPFMPIQSGSPPSASGAGFHPFVTASDGRTTSNASNVPVALFRNLHSGLVRSPTTERFDDGNIQLDVSSDFLPGWYLISVSVNGAVSTAQPFFMSKPCGSASDCPGSFCSQGDQVCCATPCAGPCGAGACVGGPPDTDAGVADGGAGGGGAGGGAAGGGESGGSGGGGSGPAAGGGAAPMLKLAVACSTVDGVPAWAALALIALLRRRRVGR
jgi:hypothetical protein